jgi:uncharacterized protein YacL
MMNIVKILGVAYVALLSFVFSFLLSHWLDKLTPKLNKNKPKWNTFIEVALQFAVIGALMYMTRSIIKKIPFPLEGVSGYIHSQLSELRSLPLIVFIFMFFQQRTQDKMRFLISTQSVIPTKIGNTPTDD